MDYATKIYELRKEADISQEALAVAIGTTRQQVSRWECGSAIPSSKYVCALADYFKVSVDEIFGEKLEITKEDLEDKGPFQFRNLILAFSGVLLLIYFSSVLVGNFSDEFSKYLHSIIGNIRDAGVEYDAAAMNLSIRHLSESICAIDLAWVILSSVLVLGISLALFLRHFRSSKNKIARSDFLTSFLIVSVVVVAVSVAGSINLTIGQHVSYLGEQTFGLFDGVFFLFGAFFVADVFISFLRIILRKPLAERMVLRPWGKTRKTLEIVYVVFGAILFTAFLLLGTRAIVGFYIAGFVFFPTATILFLAHIIVTYFPTAHSK